jgi:hypothetical protein
MDTRHQWTANWGSILTQIKAIIYHPIMEQDWCKIKGLPIITTAYGTSSFAVYKP